MKINKDYFNNPIVPDYILCKANKERIGILQCTEKTINLKFNNADEICFTTYLYINGEKNPYFDAIDVMKYILLPGIGFFSIISVDINSEGTDLENKDITAKSYECLIAQKYLEEFTINMGTAGSIDGVQFYNIRDKSKSLLHLVLEKCPDWKIGHIDASLITMQRSFEITRQDVYSFLSDDVAQVFECFFLFDTLANTINVSKEDNVGKDTNIHVSYANLLKSTNMSCSTDNIKTCLTITGSDGLTVREINMGYDKIYNFDYYNSTEFMSKSLFNSYNNWIALRKSKLPTYTSLLSQYQNYFSQINFLTHKKMPSTTGSTNWTEYGLQPLKEQLVSYEQRQSVSMKAGHGDPSSQFYTSEYLPIYNTIQAINAQIKVVEKEIESLKSQQASIYTQMTQLVNAVSMQSNFTANELKELNSFIREDELNSSNYIITDSMTDDEKFEMLNNMLEFGESELAKVSVPQLTFGTDMVNLFAIPEFEAFQDDFEPGNYIWVTLRDNFSIKVKLLSIHVNFYNPTDFSVSFGNIIRKDKNHYTHIQDIINETKSLSTSVSFNASHWNQSAIDTSIIGKIIDEGLIAAGKYLKNGDDSEMIIDTRGIFVNTISGNFAYKDSIFIGGGRILFTSDNWKTVAMSVGRADVTIKGVTESRFGTFADFILAGYIGGSILEGSEIYGGILKSSNYVSETSGTFINLNNGTFEFNANNEPKLTLDSNGILAVKGIIKAEEGWIGGENGLIIKNGKLYSHKDSLTSNADGVYLGIDGIALGSNSKFKALPDGTFYAEKGYLGGTNGFTLERNKIYNGKPAISDTSNGIYLGTDGIALGASNAFSVTQQGFLTAKSGIIGGALLNNNAIHSQNGKWWIRSDGTSSFEDVYVSNVQNGSNFGSVNFINGITSGNFNGNSYYGSNVNTPFSGTTIPHIQYIAADYIKVNYLDAINANITNLQAKDAEIENLIATKASIDELNAAVARIGTLESTTITSEKVYAEFMEVKNWVSAGYIRADKIDVNTILSKIAGSDTLVCKNFVCSETANISNAILSNVNFSGLSLHWESIKVLDENGHPITITYVGGTL